MCEKRKNANFRGLRKMRVFAYIARRYNSAAEATNNNNNNNNKTKLYS